MNESDCLPACLCVRLSQVVCLHVFVDLNDSFSSTSLLPAVNWDRLIFYAQSYSSRKSSVLPMYAVSDFFVYVSMRRNDQELYLAEVISLDLSDVIYSA